MQNVFKNKTNLIKTNIILLLFLTAAIAIAMVGLNAYASQLQYEINSMNSDIQSTSYKIANLEAKIHTATNVNNLEGRALEMGLIYPDFNRIVMIKGMDENVTDFAMALKRNANN